MLGISGVKWQDSETSFKLFEPTNVSDSNPQAPKKHNKAKVRLRKTARVSDSADENGSDRCNPVTKDCFPPLLANEALEQAVSDVTLIMDGRTSTHIFKLLAVLLKPPPDLNLSAIEGLDEYLTLLVVRLGKLTGNGMRMFFTRCCWVLLGKRSTPDISLV